MGAVKRAIARSRWASVSRLAALVVFASSFVACSQEPTRRVHDCTPSDVETEATHPKAKRLQQLLDARIRGGLPGAQMAVTERGQTWFGAAGVPDLDEPERPFETCHQTTIKSITKTFVSVRAMQLVESGALALGDHLAELLPAEMLTGLPNVDHITLRQLLNHTSGLVHYPEVVSYVLEFLNDSTRSHSVDEALDAVRGLDAYFEPGTGYHYSNTNTLLLQRIIEHHTGHTLERELRDHIWRPLGLEHTHLHQDQPLSNHVPWGYMDLYGNGDAHRIATLDDVASAAGGMESTPLDLIRFSQALLTTTDLLSNESVDSMKDVIATDAGEWGYDGAGLGLKRWQTPLGETWGHTGEDTGYKAYWHYAPERDLTWVLLLNANYGQFADRAAALRAAALELLAEE